MTASSAAAQRRVDRRRLSSLDRSPGTLIVACACGVALWVGWSRREDSWLTPDEGAGYALGVLGLLLMALLLLYSLRKRSRAMQSWGPLRYWFATHMVLGILGPTAILFHANFQVRSPNARIALGSMLTVAASGFFGRFIYTRVHRGLYGQRQTLRELSQRAAATREKLASTLAGFARAEARVRKLEEAALRPNRGLLSLAGLSLTIGLRAAATRRAVAAELAAGRGPDARRPPDAKQLLAAHLGAIRSAARFGFWERAFGLWHALHFPLTAALFIAAVIHVIAVHAY